MLGDIFSHLNHSTKTRSSCSWLADPETPVSSTSGRFRKSLSGSSCLMNPKVDLWRKKSLVRKHLVNMSEQFSVPNLYFKESSSASILLLSQCNRISIWRERFGTSLPAMRVKALSESVPSEWILHFLPHIPAAHCRLSCKRMPVQWILEILPVRHTTQLRRNLVGMN